MAGFLRTCLTKTCKQTKLPLLTSSHNLPAITSQASYHEPTRKSGYETNEEIPLREHMKTGLKMLGPEMKKYKDEWVHKWRCEHFIPLEPNDYEVVWKFDNKEILENWIITNDSDHGEGKSKGEFVFGRNKKALFRGTLDATLPKDGKIKRAGYCNIKSPKQYKSFQRAIPYDWSDYTHLLMKVRGDGRGYQLTLQMDRFFDLQWNDVYSFALFTKGGPYWQIAKIPFSKFFLTSKGRIQDKQEAVQLDKVASFGITVGDSYSGPFQLEIDYVGLVYDPSHTEEFAYEMYACDPYLLG